MQGQPEHRGAPGRQQTPRREHLQDDHPRHSADLARRRGLGVIDTGKTPGGCWTHFSSIHTMGYRTLHAGQVVLVDWESAQQEGYAFRTIRTWSADQQPVDPKTTIIDSSGAYSSCLTIIWDDGTTTTSQLPSRERHRPRRPPSRQSAARLAACRAPTSMTAATARRFRCRLGGRLAGVGDVLVSAVHAQVVEVVPCTQRVV